MNLVKTICATVLLCTSSQLFGAVIYWTNPSQGQFNDPSNWNSNSVPTSADDARVNNGGTAIIDSTMTQALTLLQIADTNTTTGTVRMTGGSLVLSSDLRAGGSSATAGGTGIFQLEGGAVLVSGNLNVGFGTNNANGTYNIFGGSIQCNAAGPIFAVGNRGTGTVNQTNGTIYLRNTSGLTQLGRNVANATGFGTYNLSGGTLATARLVFGNANGGTAISTNTFTLSGTGTLLCNSISNINTTAVNTFNFNGGTLSVNTSKLSITNNGGVFSPSTPDFANAGGTNFASLPINPIGTSIFLGANTYVQGSNGTLAIDIAGDNSFDSLLITNAPLAANSIIDGTITVNFLNGYVPAVGATFDVVTADTISSTATVVANNGAALTPSIVTFFGTDGLSHQKLRLTVTTQPVVTPQLSVALPALGTVQINFTNTPNHTFKVQASSDLTAGFNTIATATESTPGNYQFSEPVNGKKFYRVVFP